MQNSLLHISARRRVALSGNSNVMERARPIAGSGAAGGETGAWRLVEAQASGEEGARQKSPGSNKSPRAR
jgi:hypothetical protein